MTALLQYWDAYPTHVRQTILGICLLIPLAIAAGISPLTALYILIAAGGLLLLTRADWALAIFVVAMAMGNILPPFNLPVVNIALTWANALAVVLFAATIWQQKRKGASLAWNRSLTFMFLFVTWTAVTLFWAADLRDGLVRVIAWYIFFLAYWSLTIHLRDAEMRDFIMRVLLFAGIVLIFLGIASAPSLLETRRAIMGINPNSFVSRFLVTVIAVGWLTSRYTVSYKTRVLVLYVIAAAVFAAIAGSRGELIALVVLSLLFALRGATRGVGQIVILFFVISFVALPEIYNPVMTRFAAEEGEITLGGRTGIWLIAWSVFQTSPIFGVGVGGTQAVIGSFMGRASVSPHNPLILIALDTGLVGLTLFLGMMLSAILPFARSLVRGWRESGVNFSYNGWLLASCFAAYMLSWGKSGGAQHAIALYLFLALLYVMGKNYYQLMVEPA